MVHNDEQALSYLEARFSRARDDYQRLTAPPAVVTTTRPQALLAKRSPTTWRWQPLWPVALSGAVAAALLVVLPSYTKLWQGAKPAITSPTTVSAKSLTLRPPPPALPQRPRQLAPALDIHIGALNQRQRPAAPLSWRPSPKAANTRASEA